MHAIGHRVLRSDPRARVVYVSSETFTNEFITAIKNNQTVEFRNRYRTVDVLLIDDIQFFEGKEQTQEEFFHTFNTLHEASKQLVISSDRPPKDIQTLENRLRSRFEWGLLTDIQSPDLETREAILRKKAESDGIDVPHEVTSYIAKIIPSNIRQLEGALIKLTAYASLYKQALTVELATDVLRNEINESAAAQGHDLAHQGESRSLPRHHAQGARRPAPRSALDGAASNRDVPRMRPDERVAAADRARIRQEGPHDGHVRARQGQTADGTRP